jgi:xylulokinase
MNLGHRKESGRLVVGLDCSTTGTKAIAFDRSGNVVARAFEPVPLSSPQPGYYEQDPADWWGSAQRALRETARQVDPASIIAVAIANQRETFVPLDGEGGCLRPAIVWLDERCKDEVESFSGRIGKQTIHRITGKPPDYAPVVYRLAWMKRHEPDLFSRIRWVADVHAYCVWKLTGSWMTSWASADPFGLFDARKKRWAPLILKALGLRSSQFPVPCCPGTLLGRIGEGAAKLTGLSPGTAVVAGGGDGQAAGLGANALTPERAYLNLGTAVVAGVYGTRFRTSRAFRTMCSCSGAGYYYECSLRAGTFSIEWLIRRVLNIDPSEQPGIHGELQREAEHIPAGSGGLLYLPYLCGVMNPYWDMNARGAFVGLSSSHGRGHLYRSILEGIAFEQFSAIRAVEKSLGSRVREFVAIGGGAGSELWCQILADVTGKRLCIPETTEASALGAAIAAAVGAGWYRTFQGAADGMTRIRRRIKPDGRSDYGRLFAAYRALYPSLRRAGLSSGARR